MNSAGNVVAAVMMGLVGLSFLVDDGPFKCSQLIVWIGVFTIVYLGAH